MAPAVHRNPRQILFSPPSSSPLSSRPSIRDFVPGENSPFSPRQRRLLDALEPRAKRILQPQSAECAVFKNTLTLHTKSCALQSGLPVQTRSCGRSHQQHFHRAGLRGAERASQNARVQLRQVQTFSRMKIDRFNKANEVHVENAAL